MNNLNAGARRIAISIIIGAVITSLSGLFPNPFSYRLLGVSHWGIPLPWITQIVYPNAPKILNWAEFIVDMGFWIIVFYFCYYIICKRKTKPKKTEC